MSDRKTISKKVRFEVFKRDSFKCQYCGATAPEVILHVDHIEPVSKGGDNDLMNLITSCQPCNAGKSDTRLTDDAAIQKQRAMLDELSERRDQLEMMLAWRDGLKQISEDTADVIAKAWNDQAAPMTVNETGMKTIRGWLKKFPVAVLLDAVDTAVAQYIKHDAENKIQSDSAQFAFSKIAGIARMSSLPADTRELYYIRGICRNRFSYCNESRCLEILREAAAAGVDSQQMRAIATSERNWTNWQSTMYDAINEAANG